MVEGGTLDGGGRAVLVVPIMLGGNSVVTGLVGGVTLGRVGNGGVVMIGLAGVVTLGRVGKGGVSGCVGDTFCAVVVVDVVVVVRGWVG